MLCLVAALSAAGMCALLWQLLERRSAIQAVRRLMPPAKDKSPVRTGATRLIETAGEKRGILTARVLELPRLRESMRALLDASALKWTPADLVRRSAGLFIGTFLAVTLATGDAQPLGAFAAASAAGMAPSWYVERRARKRMFRIEEQLPDCLEFISRSMRAGHAFSVAIDMAHREFSGPLASELRRVFEEQSLGQPLDVVLRKLAQRAPSLDIRFFVSAVLLQKRTGGNLAELLDKLAELMRNRFKLRARIRAVSAQGIMSGRILSAIPASVGAIMFLVNPQYARFFVVDPAGHELCLAAIGLQVVGYLIIRKLVTFEA